MGVSNRFSVLVAVVLVASCGGSGDTTDSVETPTTIDSLPVGPTDTAAEPAIVVDTELDATVGALAVQPDGRIVAGGGFTTPSMSLARFMPDGSPDVAFNETIGATLDKAVYAVAVQADGKILVGGYFTSPSTSLARFEADGTPDVAFNEAIGDSFAGGIVSIDVLADGRIVVAGQFTTPSRSLARVLPDGSMDEEFNDAIGDSLNLPVASVAVLDDGSFLIGGAFTTPTPSLARVDDTGSFDAEFAANVNGSVAGYVSTIELHRDGFVAGGQFAAPTNSLARFALDGTPDVAFNAVYQSVVGDSLDAYVEKIAVADDDSILVGGWFTLPSPWLLRLNPDGSAAIDDLPVLDAAVLSVLAHGDELVVAGAFTSPSAHLWIG